MPKLEAKVEEPKQTIAKLCSVRKAEVKGLCAAYQAKVERLCGIHSAVIKSKDTFWEAEKVCVLEKLQAWYMAKLPSLYDEQFKLDYWAEYAEGEQNTIYDPKKFSEDGLEPTCSTKPAEHAREEALVLLVLIEEGTSEATVPTGEETQVLLVPIGKGTSEATTVFISENSLLFCRSFQLL